MPACRVLGGQCALFAGSKKTRGPEEKQFHRHSKPCCLVLRLTAPTMLEQQRTMQGTTLKEGLRGILFILGAIYVGIHLRQHHQYKDTHTVNITVKNVWDGQQHRRQQQEHQHGRQSHDYYHHDNMNDQASSKTVAADHYGTITNSHWKHNPDAKSVPDDFAQTGIVPQKQKKQEEPRRTIPTQRGIRYEQKLSLDQLKVPTPIFVLSLPKSGTSSTANYFRCGLRDEHRTSIGHHWYKNATGHHDMLAVCMHRNLQSQRPLLEGCDNMKVISDAGAIWEEPLSLGEGHTTNEAQATKKQCFYPSIHALGEIYQNFPNATILVVNRDPKAWVESARKYRNMLRRWSYACPGFPGYKQKGRHENAQTLPHLSDETWMNFYEDHAASIRIYCKNNPSLTCLETNLETAGPYLHEHVGIPQECWDHCKPGQPCTTI